MSAEQLSKLSLSDTMVTTRAGAARARAGQTPQESPTSSPISPTPSLIESANGHVYDISSFDQELRRRAKVGLVKDDNNIRMRFCTQTEDGITYFHIDDDITVKLEDERVPKCSCGAVQNGKTCKHIFWIIGQLTSVLPKTQTIHLAGDGSSVRNTHPARVLKMRPLQDFADELQWIIEDDDLPDSDELADEISNILSVFDPTGALPDEFKNQDTQELSELSRLYRVEFQEVIVEHATRYPAFYLDLKDRITPQFQVKHFFDLVGKRIDQAFRGLDEYIERGPTNRRSEGLDVVNCASRLRSLVKKIRDYHADTLDSEAGERRDETQVEMLAAAALIRILDEVVRRNCDAYADSTWRMPSNDPMESNLFACLIGPATEERMFFALDSLREMAPSVVQHYAMDLGNIERSLLSTPLTPPAYLDAFRTLVQDSRRKRAASESGGSSAKRTMK